MWKQVHEALPRFNTGLRDAVLTPHDGGLRSQAATRRPLSLFPHCDFRAKQPVCGACPLAKGLVGHWHAFMACCGTSTHSWVKNRD